MTWNDRFQEAESKLAVLRERRAVLMAEEQRKAAERESIRKALQEAEVDLCDLPAEEARLRREVEEAVTLAESLVSKFEADLANPTSPEASDEIEIG